MRIKKLWKILLVIICACMTLTIAACGGETPDEGNSGNGNTGTPIVTPNKPENPPENPDKPENPVEHVHDYSMQNPIVDYLAEPATCDSPALYYYVCDCGEISDETYDYGSPSHDYQAIETKDAVYKEGDCMMPDEYFYSCNDCGELNRSKTFMGKTTGAHSYICQSETLETLCSEGDCLTYPTYYYSCVCGEIDPARKTFSGSTFGAHVYDRDVVDKAYLAVDASCYSAAKYFYSCKCGEKDWDWSHTFTYGEAKGHNYQEIPVGEPIYGASCEAGPTYYTYCENCESHSYTDTFTYGEGTGHLFTRQNRNNPDNRKSYANCQSPAVWYYECETCGKRSGDDKTFTYGDLGACDYSVQVFDEAHFAQAATCLCYAAYYLDCQYCGTMSDSQVGYYAEGGYGDHVYTLEFENTECFYKEADCYSGRSFYLTCEACYMCSYDEKYIFSVSEPRGHIPTQDGKYLITEATCQKRAVCQTHCLDCDYLFEETVVYRGITYEPTFPYGNTAPHTYGRTDDLSYLAEGATCTSRAKYYYTCECGARDPLHVFAYGEPLPHTYTLEDITETNMAALGDCNTKTTYYKLCKDCKAASNELTFEDDYVHTGGKATCTLGAQCPTCKVVYTEKLGHIDTAYICTRCNQKIFSEGLEFTLVYDSYDYTEKGYEYIITIGTCKDAEVLIPDTYCGFPIDRVALYDCPFVTKIILSETVDEVWNPEGLQEYAINGNNPKFEVYDGVLYNKDVGTGNFANYKIPTKKQGALTMKDGIKLLSITGYSDITSVTVPASVERLDSFDGCTNLTSLYFQGTLAEWCDLQFINIDAFLKKNSLGELDINVYIDGELLAGELIIPEGVTQIPAYAFMAMNSLTSVVIPDTVTLIEANAFLGCRNLTTVTLGKNVTFEKMALYYTNVYTTYFNGDLKTWCEMDHIEGLCYTHLYIQGTLVEGELTIPDTVTKIGESAFYANESITKVSIPASVETIGAGAFNGCSALESVTLSEGLKEIGMCAFGFTLIKEIVIPDSVELVGIDAFEECKLLTKAVVGIGVTEISSGVFGGTALQTLEGGENVVSIGQMAFERTKISTYNNAKVTSVGDRAFSDCRDLRTVTLGALETLDKSAFEYTYSLQVVFISEESPAYVSIDDILYNKDITEFVLIPLNYHGVAVIPEGVTSIPEKAFYERTNLYGVSLPSTMESIGTNAFYNCSKLLEVQNLSSNVTVTLGGEDNGYVGYYAKHVYTDATASFITAYEDGSYTYADGEGKVYFLGYAGFASELTIPDGVTDIIEKPLYEHMYAKKRFLTSITIPASVTTILDSFSNDAYFESVYYEGTLAEWCDITNDFGTDSSSFYYAENFYIGDVIVDGVLTISEDIQTIKSGAFIMPAIKKVVINGSVETIEYGAFGSGLTHFVVNGYVGTLDSLLDTTHNLQSFVVNGKVGTIECQNTFGYYSGHDFTEVYINDCDSIEYGVFYNCTEVTSITLGNAVANAGESFWENFINLTAIYYTGTVDDWAQLSFGHYESPFTYTQNIYFQGELLPETLEISSEVTDLGACIFNGCTTVKKLVLPETLTEIPDDAFYQFTGLTQIVIPDSVKTIGNYAFYWCKGLQSITLPSGLESIGNHAFMSCSSLQTLVIRASVTNIGYYATDGMALQVVYYEGTEKDMANIYIGSANSTLLEATWYFYSETEPALDETGAAYAGNFWRYVDGKPKVWRKETV